MRPHRTSPAAVRAGGGRTAMVCAVAACTTLLTGCGDDVRDPVSAGRAPSAVGPSRLWPELPAASAAPHDYGEGVTARIPGVEVPAGGVRELDPVAVVTAGLKAVPARADDSDVLPAETVRQVRACPADPGDCPVLAPYYRDLTGDGEDELILAVRLPGRQLSVRVYSAGRAGLTRIMATSDAVISVQLAGRDLIVRAPSVIPGYEYRTAWSWDRRQGAMLPTRDEILRSPDGSGWRPPGSGRPSPSATGPAAPSPTPAPSGTGRTP
ncbi:hypothetical protein [uncultured Streptomyces sp.]|uniref:hypothetical protein n=1 Tax=uncultured Streptomyces sp. TaxID=174707 RepID=UPI002610EFDE|nr:hypothetical protein [uncultured Streptomyces sp.]